jgi:hypothetical protein
LTGTLIIVLNIRQLFVSGGASLPLVLAAIGVTLALCAIPVTMGLRTYWQQRRANEAQASAIATTVDDPQ